MLASWWLSYVKHKTNLLEVCCPSYNLATPVDDATLLSGSNQTEFDVGPKSHSEGSSRLYASDSFILYASSERIIWSRVLGTRDQN
jgi:hypothetical protein